MIKKIGKSILLGVALASLAEKEAKKHLGKLVKEGKIKAEGAKKIVDVVVSETKKEGKRIEKILIAEAKKEAKKVKPLVESSIKNIIANSKRKIS